MSTMPAAYRKIASHFRNKYPGTSFANQNQILSDATDVACEIYGVSPSQLGMWQGSWNPNDPDNSEGYHEWANAEDLVPPSRVDEWVRTCSYIGLIGWIRDSSYAGGGMSPTHFHAFLLFYMNKKYVRAGIIAQQRDYFLGLNGLKNRGKDRHAALRPDLKGVQFISKTPSRNAVVTADTHSYTQPGKALAHQDATRKKGYKLTNAVGIVRVWKLDSNFNKITGSSVTMVVTDGLRFYDAKKVKFV